MLRRFSLPVILAAIVLAGALPGHAGTYQKTYYGTTAGFLIVTFNPAKDFGNPADHGNPYELASSLKGLDPAVDDTIDTLDGTPADQNPLNGTPADRNFLLGTPADNHVAGVSFETFAGTPTRLKIADQAGLPVPWVAAQCLQDGFCGQEGDPGAKGCGTPAGGALLGGFKPGKPVTVWVMTNDSLNIWGGGECDGPGTTGTVTLITA